MNQPKKRNREGKRKKEFNQKQENEFAKEERTAS